MIEFVKGNIFDRKVDIMVNPVNCMGVMGAGLAKNFRNRYPAMFEDYKKFCEGKYLRVGTYHVWNEPDLTIVNLPTKMMWQDKSNYSLIEKSLMALRLFLLTQGYRTVSVPALGCGLGGLDWAIVSLMMRGALYDLNCKIFIYEPE